MKNFLKQNWFKFSVLTVFIILVCGVFIYLQNINKSTSQEKVDIVTNETKVKNIDFQIKCASQAKVFFEYFTSDPLGRKEDEFSNYYNSKLNKCFVLVKRYIRTRDSDYLPSGFSKDLYDAIEKKKYGSYSMPDKIKKDSEVAPLWCEMYPEGNDSSIKNCNSEDEFDAFVDTYMKN